MFIELSELYAEERIEHKHSYNYLKLFKHIKDNQIFYNTLFKLGFEYTKYSSDNGENEEAQKYLNTTEHIDYHIEFFKAGMNAIIKKWLKSGCKETPEEINNILLTEYKGKSLD